MFSSNGSVVVLSSLDFTWKKLTDSVKSMEPEKIYSYIQNEILSVKDGVLKGATVCTQETPETGVYT